MLPLVAPSVCGVVMGLALSQVNAYLSFLCPTETRIAAKMVVNEVSLLMARLVMGKSTVHGQIIYYQE